MSLFSVYFKNLFEFDFKKLALVIAVFFGFCNVAYSFAYNSGLKINQFHTQQDVQISGKILDGNGQPLHYATVKLTDYDRTTYSDKNGNYAIRISRRNIENLRIVYSMVGKTTVDSTVTLSSADSYRINIVLKNLSLSLKEVEVSSVQKTTKLSNSSVVFNSQTIEQSQAFSLTDILNLLPGKLYSPVDLQSPKNITLRTEGTEGVARNNAMGVAIIIDGLAQSNNANMQTRNIGTYALGNSLVRDNTNNAQYDVTFGGLDLREIPVDNIESIEVISGVAPAQYGDLTDGAVVINRKAGRTPFAFNTRINNGSTNFSLGKGFQLPNKLGFLNANFNYLISNNDPRDDMKKYNRVSGGLMHTIYFSKQVKNTFSFDFSEKLDDAKQDPDDGREYMAYSKNRNFNISNRFSLQLDNPLLRRISFNAGLSFGYQESYSQYFINGNVKPMANKDTTGVYEGFYIPGTYLAVDHIIGKPLNFNSNLSFSSDFNTGAIKHILNYGANLSLSNNGGQGVLFDPQRPRLVSQGYKNERPYDFQTVPDLINFGFYVEDSFNIKVFTKRLKFNTGLRYDIQNGYGTLQPRLSSNLSLTKNLNLNMAYGIATKAPTMAYRYPGPTYFDIPIFNLYTGDVRNSLFLVYTHKYVPDNSNLKPSKSNQVEAGLSYQHKLFNVSVNGYFKNNENGFNSQTSLFYLDVPEYTYTITNNQKPVYEPTGTSRIVSGLSNGVTANNVRSKTSGLDFFVSMKKIQALQTSFSVNGSYGFSSYYNFGDFIQSASVDDILANKKAWYAVYERAETTNRSLTTKLTSDTHFPNLGLVASLYVDLVWLRTQDNLGDGNRYPKAYLDKNGNYYPIENFDATNPDYGHLLKQPERTTQTKLPFAYGNVSMRIAKELKNNIRFSVNAYNILNLNPSYYDALLDKPYNYLSPTTVGAEISIKF